MEPYFRELVAGKNRLRRRARHGRPGWWLAALCLVVTLSSAVRVAAQSPDNVLLIINASSPESVQVGEYYARKRSIGADRTLTVEVEPVDQIQRAAYSARIEAPIAAWLTQHGLHDRILYIVLTKGVPLRIAGTTGRKGTVASVDSELALLYRRMTGQPIAPHGSVPNPYFLADRAIGEARPFSHESLDVFLVTRLDGFTVSDVTALIDRGLDAGRAGRIALDQRASLISDVGNRWLQRSAERLRSVGLEDRVLFDSTSVVLSNEDNLLGYYSWGSNDPAIRSRNQGLKFAPGALAGTFVSTNGRTFTEPPNTWNIGEWEDAATYFMGSPQSLSGDLVRQGVTGVAGHVAEPFLDATVRPDILFPAYFSGFNLVESFYLAIPYLGWQTVVVGDPLVAPFRDSLLSAQAIDRGMDPGTGLPAYFSQRAEAVLAADVPNRDVARLMLLGQTRITQGDIPAAGDAFEQATRLEPRLVVGHALLAAIYAQDGKPAQAIDRYRRILDLAPDNVAALNNLAYALAKDHPESREEALRLARRANTVSPGNPAVLDTLAWTLHLVGDDRGARTPSHAAVRLAPNSAEVLLHSAVIDAAVGEADLAAQKLERALELNPELAGSEETRQLRVLLQNRSQ